MLPLAGLLLPAQVDGAVQSVKADQDAAAVDDAFEVPIEAETVSKRARFVLGHPRSAGRDFEIAEGEMTPSLKVRRTIVEAKYKSVLDELYKE